MKLASVIACTLIVSAGPACGKALLTPPQPAEMPNWAQVRQESESALKATMFDPSSAQIEWTRGFEWGFYKPLFEARQFGWIGCGFLNGKNRMGGYVGAKEFVIVYDGKVQRADFNPIPVIPCQSSSDHPLPAAFLDAASPSGPVSVADEIAKLGVLRDKGLLTDQEFQLQKSKILSR
jgi:hypothetical protein